MSLITTIRTWITVLSGRYKQWNGLMEWNTGLDYWTELFSFLGQVSMFISTLFQVPGYYG